MAPASTPKSVHEAIALCGREIWNGPREEAHERAEKCLAGMDFSALTEPDVERVQAAVRVLARLRADARGA